MSDVMTATIPTPEPLLDPRKTFADVNDDVAAPLERKPGTLWKVFFGISLLLTLQFFCKAHCVNGSETTNNQNTN